MSTRIFETIVVGKGLIGSAAFRHSCEMGSATLLVGPDEPRVKSTHNGVFGAHYDQARLTHLHGTSDVRAELGRRSIERYRRLEELSGIDFYEPVGELFVADPGTNAKYHDTANVERSRQALTVDLVSLDHTQRIAEFPFLSFPRDSSALWERRPAGYINPRALIEAQTRVGVSRGGTVVAERVVRIEEHAAGMSVTTDSGDRHQARRVLVAAGSFSNAPGLLPEPLPLTLKTETIVLGQVPDEEMVRLEAMPAVHYDIDDPVLSDIYMVPPIRYPDGNAYIKMGANTVEDRYPTTVSDMCDWYARGNSDIMRGPLRDAVLAMVPGLEAVGWHTSRCVITRTPNALPIIDEIVPGRLYVSVGGNGSSAMSSDAIGGLAADLTLAGRWRDDLDQAAFARP
jgi:sarcosine oxidase